MVLNSLGASKSRVNGKSKTSVVAIRFQILSDFRLQIGQVSVKTSLTLNRQVKEENEESQGESSERIPGSSAILSEGMKIFWGWFYKDRAFWSLDIPSLMAWGVRPLDHKTLVWYVWTSPPHSDNLQAFLFSTLANCRFRPQILLHFCHPPTLIHGSHRHSVPGSKHPL